MTHAYGGLFLLDAVFAAVGTAFLYGVGLVRFRLADASYVGLAVFTGWSASMIGFGLAASFGADMGIGELALQSALLVTAGVALRRCLPPLNDRRLRSVGRIPTTIAAAGGLLLIVSIASSVAVAWRSGADSSWDVWAFWLPKAKAIYYFHGLDTGPGGFTTFANPTYPPAAPASAATAFHVMGGAHATLLPLQAAIVSAAFVGSAAVLLRRRVPGWISLPILAMVSFAPEFWNRIPSVLPDQSIGYLLAAATICAILWLEEEHPCWLVLGVVFLGAAALIKAEGLALGLSLALSASVVALFRRRGRWTAVLFLGPAAVLPWDWWLWRHNHRVGAAEYSWSDLLRPDYLASRTGRLSYAVHNLVHLLFSYDDWRLVMPFALIVALATARRNAAAGTLLLLWLVLAFTSLAIVYWIGLPEIHWYVATSAQRVVGTIPIVLGTVSPLLVALALPERRTSAALSTPLAAGAPPGSYAPGS